MKWIITTVGTSIFENLIEKRRLSENDWNIVKKEVFSSWETVKGERERLKQEAREALAEDPFSISAELHSLDKIRQKLDEKLGVILLASDSVASALAAELLKGFLEEMNWVEVVNFVPKYYSEGNVIQGLRIDNGKAFLEDGLENLFNFLTWNLMNSGGNLAVNITGGFKATIPFLTLFASLHSLSIYYIYETSEVLIEIPPLPLRIDREFMDTYFPILEEIEEGTNIEKYGGLIEKIKGFIYVEGNEAILSDLGRVFLKTFREQTAVYYVNEEVKKAIEENKDFRMFLQKVFWNKEERKNWTEMKNARDSRFIVYDHGGHRIFYIEKKNNEKTKIYIYKYFPAKKHDEYEAFLDSPYSKVPTSEELTKFKPIYLEKL